MLPLRIATIKGMPRASNQFSINFVTTIRRHCAGGFRKGMNVKIGSILLVLAGVASLPLISQDWPMWGGAAQRNMASAMTNLPESWDVKSGKNIKWKAQIGSTSFGNPVVADGKLFLGTNNGNPRNPKIQGDKGVLMCFREFDGKFLWQAVTDKLASGPQNDFPEQGVCSSPAVDGKRLYYVSNRGELVCLDTEGFLDGKNDGPFQGEVYKGPSDDDIVWQLDMSGAFIYRAARILSLYPGVQW